MTDGKACVERAKSGEKLTKSERLLAIAFLDEHGPTSVPQLAQLFRVSTRQIRYDLEQLRKEYQRAALEMSLLGEAFRNYTQQLSLIDNRLISSALDDRVRVSYLRERRELLFGFLDRLTALRIEDALRKAVTNERVGNTAPASANGT